MKEPTEQNRPTHLSKQSWHILTDPNASWRKQPASVKQMELLTRFGIEHTSDITAGRASDLLRPVIVRATLEHRRQARKRG